MRKLPKNRKKFLPIPVLRVVGEDEIQKKHLVGIELQGFYDGVLYWYDPMTNKAYPRKGFLKEFKEIFDL